MEFLQRSFSLLFEPDYATATLYDSPRLGDGFVTVSLYAGLSSFNSGLSALLATQMFSVGLIAFFGSALIVYLTWIFLSIIFHLAAEVLGGLGEFPHALAFVGLAATPMLFTSIMSIVLTIVAPVFFADDPGLILKKVGLAISVIGMAWGWPGILCYFGMKNAERVDSIKALIVTIIVFAGFATFEVVSSSAW